MNQLTEKYHPSNWETWQDLSSKFYNEEVNDKCDICGFAFPDGCAATYYGIPIIEITDTQKKDCDFEINFSIYMDIGNSGIDSNFNEYINSQI